MPTLYNQYIYRNGAWRQTGTSSDSITYQISLSGDILTLTGSDGSTSSVTVSGGGGSSDIFVAEYNTTSNADVLSAYNAGKAIFAVYDHIVYGLVNYTAGSGNPTNIFRFYAPDQGLRVKEVLCQLQNGTTTVWQNSAVSTRLGNITEDGDITGNGVTIANGDRLIINDESASKLDNSSITFGTDTTKYLANNGTWQSIPENTSDLTNDSNFVSDANYVHTDNNFTDALETKLNGIAAGATVDDHKWNDVVLNKTAFTDDSDYYIPSLLGTSATSAGLLKVNQGAVNQSIPRRTSDGFIVSKTPTAGDNTTKVATTAFVKSAVDTAISGVNSFEYEVVQSLPTTNIKDHTIYLVPKTGTTGDVYDEYLRISNAWEHIGSTDVDLSGYVPTSRTVNGKALSSNISLTASDVGALSSSTVIPSATSTTPIMDGTAAVGTETTFAKGDHVHPSDTSKVSKSGDTMTGALIFNRKQNSDSKIILSFNDNSATMISPTGYQGTATNNTPVIEFMSTHANSSGSSDYNTILRRIATPSNNNDATNKQYVDTAVSAKQSKPTIASTTLAVASWSNGVYSFESTYPNANYNIDVEPDGYTITDAQFKAWNEAKIVGNSNGNTIKALGTVPTVAIPVVVRATPK